MTGSGGGVVVRVRGAGDVAEAAGALVVVHGTDGYPVEGVADGEAWLSPPGLVRAWVAELAGRVVGHVALSRPAADEAVELWLAGHPREPAPVLSLARLFVHPAARRRAAGEHLVRAATAHAHHLGARLVLDVVTKDTAAIRLYERLGWRRFGTAPHVFDGDRQADAACYVAPDA